MPLYRDEAVVLRTHKLAEADRIITLLTRQHGVVRAVAKGVRRTSSKFGSRLEPFTRVDLQLAVGRNLDVITQAETRSSYGEAISGDYASYTAGSVMVEVAERLLTEERQPALQQYQLLAGGLAAIAHRLHRPGDVMDSFVLRSLAIAGYAPSFLACAGCGRPGIHRWYQPAAGGMLCEDCRVSGASRPSEETVVWLGALLAGDWDTVDSATEEVRKEGRGMVAAFLSWHLEGRVRSWPYANEAAG